MNLLEQITKQIGVMEQLKNTFTKAENVRLVLTMISRWQSGHRHDLGEFIEPMRNLFKDLDGLTFVIPTAKPFGCWLRSDIGIIQVSMTEERIRAKLIS